MRILFEDNLNLISCKLSSSVSNLKDVDEIVYSGDIKFDTGADITVFSAIDLGIGCKESDFTDWIQRYGNVKVIKDGHIKNHALVASSTLGIDKSAKSIHSYVIQLDFFKIVYKSLELDLKSIPIFVTFDSRFKDSLLGKDLLSLLNYAVNNDEKYLDVELTKKYSDDLLNDSYCGTPVYFFKNGIYGNGIHRLNENKTINGEELENAFRSFLG